MSAIKFRSNAVWKRTWRVAHTNKWYTQWQRCFYNNTHQSANGCCPHGSNFLCVTHFPKVNCLEKISMIHRNNQRCNFNSVKFRHRISKTLREELMWQESWADPRKFPEWEGRELRLVISIVVQFFPLYRLPKIDMLFQFLLTSSPQNEVFLWF